MTSPSAKPFSDAVANHYDELDWFYRDTWGGYLHHGYWKIGNESTEEAISNLQSEIADLAEISSGVRVCDIGCGYGSTAIYWANTYHATVTGITLSRKQWEIATEQAKKATETGANTQFVLGNWLENDFESSYFDAAVSIECLSHVDDKSAFFKEAARVIKPDGVLALTAWTSRSPHSKLLESICKGGRFASLATETELRQWSHDAGIQIESLESIGPSVRKTWSIIIGRLVKRVCTRRKYRAFLWQQLSGDRRLLFITLQVWFAFQTGKLGYVMLKGRKSSRTGNS